MQFIMYPWNKQEYHPIWRPTA